MGQEVELQDVQGIILQGYGKMAFANFILLHFNDVSKAKSWLAQLADKLTGAAIDSKTLSSCVNIAFTKNGVIGN